MNREETAKLFRMAHAAFPGKKFDDYTPDLWEELFAGYSYEDMRASLVWCTSNKEFLNVKDMLGEVRRIRGKRIESEFEKLYPPADLDPDDSRAYIRWLSAATKAIGDGDVPEPPKNLVQGNVRQLAAGFRDVPDADAEEAS